MKAIDMKDFADLVIPADYDEGAGVHDLELEDGTAVEFKTYVDFIGRTVHPRDRDAEPYFDGRANVQVYDVTGYAKDGSVMPVKNIDAFAIELETKINDAL